MAWAWLLALQAAAEPSLSAAVPADFDLAKVRPRDDEWRFGRSCRREGSDEIVVCARRRPGNDYPLEEEARRFREKPIVAETAIGPGATLRAYGESAAMPDGQISKRAMIGVKLRF